MLNDIRSVFTTISKITKEVFVKICWQLKTPTRSWKCTHCIMQMSYLYVSAFPFKNCCKLVQHGETIRKKCLGKEWWPVLVVDKSTDHDKPHFNLFFTAAAISTPKKFFQSASWLRHSTLRGTLTRAAWYGQGIDSFRQPPSNFWLVRSGHTHASYPGLSFRLRVRSQHIWGGKKGEFRDWTSITCGCWSFLASGFRLVFEGLFIWAQ